MDTKALTDEELKEHLMKYGITPGPIVASTRMVYEKKLLKLMGQGPSVPPLKQNGTGDLDQYSDSEEEDDFPPEGAAARVTVSESSYLRQTITQKGATANRSGQVQVDGGKDVLSKTLTSEVDSPLGISATRRRPIKGAAGRPVQYRYDDLLTQAKERSSATAKRDASPAPRLVPVWLQLLLFIMVVFFLFLVYQAMESNQESPFAYFIEDSRNQVASQPDQLESQASPDLNPQAAQE
uniref:Lamina-associated polypeptide 2 isoform beta n=1 Tax=Callorhinchus milii TaxID=7868 RepID=V9L988_CALMI